MALELFSKSDPELISEKALIGTPEERHAISMAVLTGKTPGFRIKRPDYGKLYGFKRVRMDTEAEPEPKRRKQQKVVRFDEMPARIRTVERYPKRFGKETYNRMENCAKCKLLYHLNLDIYKFTEMEIHPNSLHNTVFHSKYFKRAQTVGDREALVKRIDTEYRQARCAKHNTVIQYVYRNFF